MENKDRHYAIFAENIKTIIDLINQAYENGLNTTIHLELENSSFKKSPNKCYYETFYSKHANEAQLREELGNGRFFVFHEGNEISGYGKREEIKILT